MSRDSHEMFEIADEDCLVLLAEHATATPSNPALVAIGNLGVTTDDDR